MKRIVAVLWMVWLAVFVGGCAIVPYDVDGIAHAKVYMGLGGEHAPDVEPALPNVLEYDGPVGIPLTLRSPLLEDVAVLLFGVDTGLVGVAIDVVQWGVGWIVKDDANEVG